ncbi:ABC transporter ATP-binding protein [Sulfurimonas sp.]
MITFKNVSKIFANNLVALENININFKEGELIVLKGVSGSGKSTMLSLIAALQKPTVGELIVDSNHISKLPDHFASLYRRDNIGFIFQRYNLIGTMSVADNIILPMLPKNMDEKLLEIDLNRVLKMFNIEHKRETLVKNLSGGEQQRVAIARSNIASPKIILADEPTANLDEKLSLEFIEILKEMKSANRTIVVATHDPLFFSLDFVDRVVEIHDGKIVV